MHLAPPLRFRLIICIQKPRSELSIRMLAPTFTVSRTKQVLDRLATLGAQNSPTQRSHFKMLPTLKVHLSYNSAYCKNIREE